MSVTPEQRVILDGLRVACVLTTDDYYYGDPRPAKAAGYGEFVAWQEAQLKRRKRPAKRGEV